MFLSLWYNCFLANLFSGEGRSAVGLWWEQRTVSWTPKPLKLTQSWQLTVQAPWQSVLMALKEGWNKRAAWSKCVSAMCMLTFMCSPEMLTLFVKVPVDVNSPVQLSCVLFQSLLHAWVFSGCRSSENTQIGFQHLSITIYSWYIAFWKRVRIHWSLTMQPPQRVFPGLGSMSSVKFMGTPWAPLRCSGILCNLSWIPSIMV